MPIGRRRVLDEQEPRASRLNIHPSAMDGEEAEPYYDGIGAELRAERVRCGLELTEVSQRLRIRIGHLEAIEAGRFGDLPGRIYAIGFLRSYAEFLGADGDICISLFKAEAGPSGHSRKLIFPIPPEENRRPGLVTLAASLVLAGLVYGGWYMTSDRPDQRADLVPDVPERIAEQLRDGAADQALASERSLLSGSGGAIAAEVAPERTPVAEILLTPETQTVDLAVVGRPRVTESTVSDATTITDAGSTAETEAVESVSGQAAEPLTAVETAPVVTVPAVDAQPVQLAAVAPPPPIPAITTDGAAQPRVLGIANRGSRVTVRAVRTAEIIVIQSSGGTVLPSRILKAGDSYMAPNRGGIILKSGNIGGLEILVDGRLIGNADALAAPASALLLDAELLASLID